MSRAWLSSAVFAAATCLLAIGCGGEEEPVTTNSVGQTEQTLCLVGHQVDFDKLKQGVFGSGIVISPYKPILPGAPVARHDASQFIETAGARAPRAFGEQTVAAGHSALSGVGQVEAAAAINAAVLPTAFQGASIVRAHITGEAALDKVHELLGTGAIVQVPLSTHCK